MLNFLKLGLIYRLDKGNKYLISHRSLLKVVANPLLRLFFGVQLSSIVNATTHEVLGYELVPSPRVNTFRQSWIPEVFDHSVEFRRWLF